MAGGEGDLEGNECPIGTIPLKKWVIPDNLLDTQVADTN